MKMLGMTLAAGLMLAIAGTRIQATSDLRQPLQRPERDHRPGRGATEQRLQQL